MVNPKRSGRGFTLIELIIVVGILMILAGIGVHNYLEAHTRTKVARVRAEFRSVAIAVDSFEMDNNMYPPSRPFLCPMHPDAIPGENRTTEWLANFWSLTTPVAYLPKAPFTDIFIKPRERHKHMPFSDRTALFWFDPAVHRETVATVNTDIIYCAPEDPRDPLARDPKYTYMLSFTTCGMIGAMDDREARDFEGKYQGNFDYYDRFEDSELKRPYYFITSVGPDGISGPDFKSGKLWTTHNYAWGNDHTLQNTFDRWQYDPSNGTISNGDLIRYQKE